MAGTTGPIPKRSEELIRRNASDPIDKVTAIGPVPVPPLGITDPHPLVRELWESMQKSAQKKFFEPTDWAYAKVTLHWLDEMLWKKGDKGPSAVMLAAVDSMLAKLLLTEGDRRRVRIEVERKPHPNGDEGATVLTAADRFKAAVTQQNQG